MSNFFKNVLGGLFATFYIFCFEFGIMLFVKVFGEGMPIGEFLGNQLVTFFVVWFICTMFVGFYRDMLAEANKPRDQDRNNLNDRSGDNHQSDSTDANQSDPNRDKSGKGKDDSEK